MSVLRKLLAGLGLLVFLAPGAVDRATAANSLGLTLVAWVQSIDASPDWTAHMDGLALDEENGQATIERLVVTASGGGLSVEIAGITLTGYSAGDDRGFTAAKLAAENATVETPDADIILTNVTFNDIGVPALSAIRWDKAKSFTSMIAAYSAIASSHVSSGRADELALIEKINGVKSRISYGTVEMGSLRGGKIATIEASPLKMESPAHDPLIEFSAARAKASDVDLDAFLRIYDPLRYIAGVGDNVWREAVGQVSYSDVGMTAPGMKLALGAMSLENFKVRQPKESFAPLLDALLAERKHSPTTMNDLSSRYLAGLLSTYGIGHVSIGPIALDATGIDQLTLDEVELTDLSSDGLGEFAIDHFVGAIAGQGAVELGRLALGGIVMPPLDDLAAAIEQAKRGVNVDRSALLPRLGYFEAINIGAHAIDVPATTLGGVRMDFGKYVGTIPTQIAVSLNDLDIATALLYPPRARNLIKSLGYDRVSADASFSLDWKESDGTVNLDDFHLDIDNFGKATASAALAGLTRDAIERADTDTGFLSDLIFERAKLTFEDKSVVERSLSMRADLLKVPLDRLRQQLAGALPLMLAFVGNPEKVREIVPVLQAFIKTPGTLTIEARPEPPVSVAKLEEAVKARPQSLPGMLSISVTGTPGPEVKPDKAGALDVDPFIRKTLEPESRPGTTGSTTPIPASPP